MRPGAAGRRSWHAACICHEHPHGAEVHPPHQRCGGAPASFQPLPASTSCQRFNIFAQQSARGVQRSQCRDTSVLLAIVSGSGGNDVVDVVSVLLLHSSTGRTALCTTGQPWSRFLWNFLLRAACTSSFQCYVAMYDLRNQSGCQCSTTVHYACVAFAHQWIALRSQPALQPVS